MMKNKSATVQFLNPDGQVLEEIDAHELRSAALSLVAGLLEQSKNRDEVQALITGFTLLPDVPNSIVLAKALEITVGDVLGDLARATPTMQNYLTARAIAMHQMAGAPQ